MAPDGQVVKRRPRRPKSADASAIMEGMVELMSNTLKSLLNEEQVEKAIAAAKKLPLVKRMMAGVKAPKSKGSGGGGPKQIRSAYQAFTTVAMASLKASNRADLANMTLVGQTWNKLPPAVKTKVEDRLNALKERYNQQLSGGATVEAVAEELRRMDREGGSEPLDFTALISKYKDHPTQPKAEPTPKAATPKGGKAAAAPALEAPAPAAAPAAAGDKRKPAAGGGGDESGKKKEHKKHKHEHKKDKKEKHRHGDE
ncbi:MAG: hypothetical protein J3K34DRAFT_527023 [Monoraphidium minutum]|nr:MAG: hypothetical protein J3K34DRAFT_527023 [Monoraphidium minutum]